MSKTNRIRNQPRNPSIEELRSEIDKALAFYDAGEKEEARTVLLQIYREIPKDQEDLLGVVGSLLRGCGENSAALDCFDETLRRKPFSVGASLGRVLTLWNSARYDDAFDELKRFLSVSVSERHSILLADMVEEFFDGEDKSAVDPLVLIEEMREIRARALARKRS